MYLGKSRQALNSQGDKAAHASYKYDRLNLHAYDTANRSLVPENFHPSDPILVSILRGFTLTLR